MEPTLYSAGSKELTKEPIMIPATVSPAGGGVSTYIQLCIFAQQPNIEGNVAGLTVPGGSWALTWGPAWTLTDSNLAYGAAFTPTGASAPSLVAIVTRGTDVNVDPLGFFLQIGQDLRVVDQLPLPWDTSASAAISRGTVDAWRDVTKMSSKGTLFGKNLPDYLSTVIGPVPQLVLCGHSLGGALTTALAVWLDYQYGSSLGSTSVQPVTFAAPAIGNQAFMSAYQSTYASNLGYANSLDVIPNAWAALANIPGLYSPTLTVPGVVQDVLNRIQKHLSEKNLTYVQQSQNFTTLTGTFVEESGPNDVAWAKEVLAQHVATEYAALLAAAGQAR
jgi:triacylglycerol lipase